MRITSNDNRLLRPHEAADWLKISERTLWTLNQRGELPAVRIGRNVRYDLADLIDFVEARKDEVPA
jgi:excisionase family DNA binding protein